MVFDISAGPAASLADEWNCDPYNFWLSEDGSQVFCESRNIYKTPDYLGVGSYYQSPPLLGTFLATNRTISYAMHSSALKQIFVVYPGSPSIFKFDDANYSGTGSINVHESKVIVNGYLATYTSIPAWIFVDKNGRELNVIKKAKSDVSDALYWFYEKVPL